MIVSLIHSQVNLYKNVVLKIGKMRLAFEQTIVYNFFVPLRRFYIKNQSGNIIF